MSSRVAITIAAAFLTLVSAGVAVSAVSVRAPLAVTEPSHEMTPTPAVVFAPSPSPARTALDPTATQAPSTPTPSPRSQPDTPQPTATVATPMADESREPDPDQEPFVERPVRIRIPALGVDTVVQWVGLDEQGRMATPSNYVDTAWYERGPIPGTIGNAVIAGHLDSASGPAVFYRLGDLRPGDEVIVLTSDGVELTFIVQSGETYAVADAPLERIFGPADDARLNLITCSGRFDRSVGEYDQRLVVYTVLVAP